MDDLQKSALKSVADNPLVVQLLRELILSKFPNIPKDVSELSDKELGERARARATGIKAVEDAFSELEGYKTHDKKPEIKNPAR